MKTVTMASAIEDAGVVLVLPVDSIMCLQCQLITTVRSILYFIDTTHRTKK